MAQNNALNKKSEDFTVDNLFIDGNSITSLDTNGVITLQPNGTGNVDLTTKRVNQVYTRVGFSVSSQAFNEDNTNTASNANFKAIIVGS